MERKKRVVPSRSCQQTGLYQQNVYEMKSIVILNGKKSAEIHSAIMVANMVERTEL